MRTLLLFVHLIALMLPATAQKHVYEDLLVLYVDEKYDKCLMKAENYTENDATRKDPLPYLYMSMALFEMSKREEYQEDYPKAARDALKYAEKYRKKDKDNEFFRNYEDYWAELNTMAMEEAEFYFQDAKWSKARQTYDYMIGYYPENAGAWGMLAVSQFKYNQSREAEESLVKFEEAYAALGDLERLPQDQKKLLKMALINLSIHQAENGMRSKAIATIEKGKDLFMDDPEFKLQYEELH